MNFSHQQMEILKRRRFLPFEQYDADVWRNCGNHNIYVFFYTKHQEQWKKINVHKSSGCHMAYYFQIFFNRLETEMKKEKKYFFSFQNHRQFMNSYTFCTRTICVISHFKKLSVIDSNILSIFLKIICGWQQLCSTSMENSNLNWFYFDCSLYLLLCSWDMSKHTTYTIWSSALCGNNGGVLFGACVVTTKNCFFLWITNKQLFECNRNIPMLQMKGYILHDFGMNVFFFFFSNQNWIFLIFQFFQSKLDFLNFLNFLTFSY